jgi:hypothetical protein
METAVSALCEKLLKEAGKIVGPSATNRSVSRHENETISRKCRQNHAV